VLWRLALTGCLVVWAFSGGPLQALLGWLALGYLLVRAWPGVASDLYRLRSLLRRRRGRASVRGGEF